MQRRLQLANLALRAFDHPSPPKQMARWNHKISLPSGTKLPQTPRFKQLWKRYNWGACYRAASRLTFFDISIKPSPSSNRMAWTRTSLAVDGSVLPPRRRLIGFVLDSFHMAHS